MPGDVNAVAEVHADARGRSREGVRAADLPRSLRAGIPRVVHLGGLDPRKVDAIIGADGWGVDAFDATVERLNARSRIVRCGYVSDAEKADLLAGAELLAFPSLYEGFGLPVLEAMACGTPVMCSNRASLPEVVHGISVITPPPVTEAIAEDVVRAGVAHVWMQPGADSDAAIATLRAAGVSVIAGGPCILVVLGFSDAR